MLFTSYQSLMEQAACIEEAKSCATAKMQAELDALESFVKDW
jgi:hypothetical protein